ncbi:MAG: DUF262 domain-containing protein [Magnetospirillum sp.]|nr:DUF262 domain-containing protein [Magnetospirillum sp.]
MARKPTIEASEVDEWIADEESERDASHTMLSLDPAEKYARSQLRVIRETKDYQLDYLKHVLEPGKGIINTAPGYQRRLRWNRAKKSLLVESFLLNIPVPPVFLFETDYNQYEVIDGRQRLEAIRSFLANGFALVGLEYWPELDGKRFNELPTVLQKGLLRRSVPAVVLLAETSAISFDDLDVRRALFDRLNTGGIKLNPQELRNALYPGKLNKLLVKLARSSLFTATWGIPPYTRDEEEEPSDALIKNALFSSLTDAELVLRFFALRDAIQTGKKGALKRILDRYMAANKDLKDKDEAAIEHEFLTLLERLYQLFDAKPFQLPSTARPSRPLYDALMIALSQNPELDLIRRKTPINHALEKSLQSPEEYDVLVGRGNTIEALHQRVQLATSILKS